MKEDFSQSPAYFPRRRGPSCSFKLPTTWSAGGERKPPHHGRAQKASETERTGGLHRRSALLSGCKEGVAIPPIRVINAGSAAQPPKEKLGSWQQLPHLIISHWKTPYSGQKEGHGGGKEEGEKKATELGNEAQVHRVDTVCRRDFYCAKTPLPCRGSSNSSGEWASH